MNTGNISIDAQNIMPIIKKWLYSDKDIFIRELVANGVDAITKHRMLVPDTTDNYRVVVTVDKEKGTLCFDDNGIGMTSEEVEKYINQVAFSSAEEFIKNYKGEDGKAHDGIIGHFGLGFYSAFMVAKKVSILTRSYKEGSTAVLWQSEDGMQFSMQEAEKEAFGTQIILEIAEEEKEFLDSFRVQEVLTRYCEFMKVPVYLVSEERIASARKAQAEKAEKAEKENNTEETKPVEKSPEEIGTTLINDVKPLWLKNPSDCTEEEYKEFYQKAFKTWEEPLFQVHLNVDYPFNLKGILYFPRIKRDFGNNQGQMKLFSGQVFVAENIKEIIPEYLLLLNGVIDCPDLPLNVSRSYLQNDSFVSKLKAYITKKVADRLISIFNTDRSKYESYWDDINPFIKYGCLSDKKFYEQVKKAIVLKTSEGKYLTIEEYLNANEKIGKKIYYAADKTRQAAAISLYTSKEIDVAILDMLIDNSFISFLEFDGGYEELKFVRVDADVDSFAENGDALSEDIKNSQEKLLAMFKNSLGQEELKLSLRELDDESISAVLLQDEQGRRLQEMSKMYGQSFAMPQVHTLVLNAKHPAIIALAKRDDDEVSQLICKQLYDLACMANRPLENNEITEFLNRSNKILSLLLQ